jgi:hypothetical protein
LIIYGVLLLVILYLFISVAGLKGDVNNLKANVAELQQGAAAVAESTPAPAATVTPAPQNDLATATGRDGQRKQDLAEIAEALVQYQQNSNAFPAGLNDLTPEYLDRVPSDPSSPKYNYRYRRTASGFTLTCILEQTGDADDATGDGKADQVFTLTEDFRSQ